MIEGDCRESLRALDAGSAQTCVTSPPYFGLRDYGTGQWEGGNPDCGHRVRENSRVESSTLGGGKSTTGHQREGFKVACPRCGARRVDRQLGLEPTPDEYVAELVETFREVRRVLADDGTVWLNLGDSYCAAASGARGSDRERAREGWDGAFKVPSLDRRLVSSQGADRRVLPDLKQKDLIGIPWMVAFALRADGWFLRSDIIWAKPACMPESVGDRPTRAHEYVFLLSKSARYFYDAEAIREPDAGNDHARQVLDGQPSLEPSNGLLPPHAGLRTPTGRDGLGRNKRTIWTVSPQPFPGAHFATFPPKLIEPCILAGAREGDTVLDPFAGSGTTGVVALRHRRGFIGCELSAEYVELARRRIVDDAPLLNSYAEEAVA
jgi:DNA modification methylase